LFDVTTALDGAQCRRAVETAVDPGSSMAAGVPGIAEMWVLPSALMRL
jgi:hypothetical protein